MDSSAAMLSATLLTLTSITEPFQSRDKSSLAGKLVDLRSKDAQSTTLGSSSTSLASSVSELLGKSEGSMMMAEVEAVFANRRNMSLVIVYVAHEWRMKDLRPKI
jgi:hypothetical protein